MWICKIDKEESMKTIKNYVKKHLLGILAIILLGTGYAFLAVQLLR
jgi:hypothetical protein